MNTRRWLGGLGAVCAGVLLAAHATAQGQGFRYVERSGWLATDTNPPDTDTIDTELHDVDGDGDLDLFLAEGTAGPTGRPNRLLINDGSGRFTDESASRLPSPNNANSTEVEFADVDGDGDPDAIVANLGPEQLLLNDGTGHFTDASATHLPPPPTLFADISAEAIFADVDNDHDPDIVVSNENPFNPASGAQNRLLVNDGTGHYTDQTASRLPARIDQTQGHLPLDIEGDGDLDLIVVDIGQDFVLVNDGAGHFTDQTATRFPATTDSSRKGAVGDVNGDGCADLFIGNSRNQQNRLYLNDCHGVFADVTAATLPARNDTTTDVDLADLDGDGDLDAYVTNAGDFQVGHGFLGDLNLYYENDGSGAFHEETVQHFPRPSDPSTSAVFGDVDGDGDLDLVVGNSGASAGGERLYIRAGGAPLGPPR
jgi:hypothetical protein